MVGRVEWETAARGDNEGRGRAPALPISLTGPDYKWERLGRLIPRFSGRLGAIRGEPPSDRSGRFFREASERPAIVEWSAPLKSELMIRLVRRAFRFTPRRRDEWGVLRG